MNMSKLITFAAVAASAAIPMAANADTIEINGVTWTYTPNETTRAISIDAISSVADVKDIPWSLMITGVTYKVTEVAVGVFVNKLTGRLLTIPAHVTSIGNYALQGGTYTNVVVETSASLAGEGIFSNNRQMQTAWFKGNLHLNLKNLFCLNSGMKVALFGPQVKGWSNNGYPFASTTCFGCRFYYPYGVDGWTTWKGTSGSGVEAIPYGAGRDINLEIDEERNTITATVTTASRLVAVLNSAPYFKSGFGLDAHISVTNAIDLTGVTITEQMVSGVTFDRLMFSAKEQTQLDAILGAFPATTPISIDPTGLTENMTIPNDYPNVFVKTVPGVTIKRTTKGFMIIVK